MFPFLSSHSRCVRTIVVWKRCLDFILHLHQSDRCVRTIVVWKPGWLESGVRQRPSCVRTIVVWKRPSPTCRFSAARSCVRTIVVWKRVEDREPISLLGVSCVRTIVETLPFQSIRSNHHPQLRKNHCGMETNFRFLSMCNEAGCVRTIVVWKRSGENFGMRESTLRKNHSGMETLCFHRRSGKG